MLCHHQSFGKKLLIALARYIGEAVSSDAVWSNARKSLLSALQVMCRSSKGLEHFFRCITEPKSHFLGVWIVVFLATRLG